MTRLGTARSIVPAICATVVVSRLRSTVIMRAMLRAAGGLRNRRSPGAGPSSLRRRVAHSVTTRKPPAKPAAFALRHSAAPFRHPSAHAASSCSIQASSELRRLRNTSVRPPRTTCRTTPRDRPVRWAISLIPTLSLAIARIAAFSSLRRTQPECWRVSAQVSRCGSTPPPPRALRIAGSLHGAEKGGAGVLHQMPAIRQLARFRVVPRSRLVCNPHHDPAR